MGGPLCPGCVGHSIQYLLRTYSDDNSRYTKPFDCDFAHCFEVINSRQYFTARHFVVPELTAVPLRSRLRLIIGPGLPSSTHRQALLALAERSNQRPQCQCFAWKFFKQTGSSGIKRSKKRTPKLFTVPHLPRRSLARYPGIFPATIAGYDRLRENHPTNINTTCG